MSKCSFNIVALPYYKIRNLDHTYKDFIINFFPPHFHSSPGEEMNEKNNSIFVSYHGHWL